MKTIGLALGSGGWRGLAHIGVIKALTEHGIVPHYITGSSAGSLIGGLYAHFGDIKPVESFFVDLDYQDLLYIFSDPSNNLGLIKGKKAHHYLNEYLNNADFSSLKIPFSAVVTNLRSGQAETINSGNLASAILASSSIPLIFEPMYEADNIYVDGGIAAAVPTNFFQDSIDYIIGVNLYQSIFPITKNSKQLSKIEIAVITYQLLLNQQAKSNLLHADIAIEPPIKDALFDSFKKFVNNKETVQAGYDATICQIDKIKAQLAF